MKTLFERMSETPATSFASKSKALPVETRSTPASLTAAEIDELSALRATCAAINGPSFLLRSHWHETGYGSLVRRGLVLWGDPPEGFERRKFAGASLTFRGHLALEDALNARAASADTRPEGGDATEIAAPFTSGAVPSEASADAQKDAQ